MYQLWESEGQIRKEGLILGSCGTKTGRMQNVVIMGINWSEIGSCA